MNNSFTYDFESRVNRHGIGAVKWDLMKKQNPQVGLSVMPMTVADMEFLPAPEIRQGLQQALGRYPNGYAQASESYKDAVVNWNQRRHRWSVEKEWLLDVNNVVSGLHCAIRALTEPGDGVIITRPVYGPFGQSIMTNDRVEVNVPLAIVDGYYQFDFDRFEVAASDAKNKVFILCNPHNPVGRVWTREELERIAEICMHHGVYIIADEIWRDLVMPSYSFTPMATVDDELSPYLVTCTSTSKTFNLAGFKIACMIIADEKLRSRVATEISKSRAGEIGQFSYLAAELAYNEGEAWLEELLAVIDRNQHIVHDFLGRELPEVKAPLIEGTYVQWLDFSALENDEASLQDILYQQAEFFTTPGTAFGQEGEGYQRLNLALPSQVLSESLERLRDAFQ